MKKRPALIGHRNVLIVAGTLPLGIGLVMGLPLPHDGTVSISEASLAGVTTIRVWGSHLSLVFSPKVAEVISDYFLCGSDYP